MRIRFRFSKLGRVRFTSQRDVARMWERALRRAGMPLAYTGGFSPRPQLSFGLALPTTCESLAEYVDVAMDDSRPEVGCLVVEELPQRMAALLPEGVDVRAAAEVEGGSLQQQVTSCSWTMEFGGLGRDVLMARVGALLAADRVMITRERKGRQESDDLRPSVLALRVSDAVSPAGDAGVGVVAELATQPRGVRPIELVRGLMAAGPETGRDGTPVLDRACRTNQWIERDGFRLEPLDLMGEPTEAGRAEHALERVS